MQEKAEAILVKARARNQTSLDAQLAQEMAEEYAQEAEEPKAQQNSDEAVARNLARKEAEEERQKQRGADRNSRGDGLDDHLELESDRQLRCEARGDDIVYVPIPYMRMADEAGQLVLPADEEEDGPGQLRMTEAQERTEHHVQRMVAAEAEKKRKRQQEPPSLVESDECVTCCREIPRAERVYSVCCGKWACKECFGKWLRRSTRCMYCREVWKKKKK